MSIVISLRLCYGIKIYEIDGHLLLCSKKKCNRLSLKIITVTTCLLVLSYHILLEHNVYIF